MRGFRLVAVFLLVLGLTPTVSRGQESDEPPPTIDNSLPEAADDDDPKPRRRLIKWNEYDGPISTFRLGFGLLIDLSTYLQDERSEQQVGKLHGDVGVRDSRLIFSGRLKTERPLSWVFGYMYDSADDKWRVRLTGIQIGFPELQGNLFIGRTKEGYSMIKVMTGYHPWTMERSPGSDAFVPILADGLKWSGYFPKPRVFFSLGGFSDKTSEEETFATYDYQGVTRIGWLPIASEAEKTVWHTAVMSRFGKPDEGSIRFRSKPEDSLAPFFVETPSIESDRAGTTGFETYYRKGPWLFGGEYGWQHVHPKMGRDLAFHAGDVVAAWIITGETRGYKPRGGYFDPVSPARTVFQGGPGAWEGVLHMSYIDLNNRDIQGGKLWRLTTLMNWYLSDNVRFEFSYGYGVLDRFGPDSHTHFFQSRLQFTL